MGDREEPRHGRPRAGPATPSHRPRGPFLRQPTAVPAVQPALAGEASKT